MHPDPVTYTDPTALDAADLAQATSPADAARRMLARRGITVYDYLAQDVADAVLNYASDTISVRDRCERHMWQSRDFQEHLLQRLRHRLLDEITTQGCVPTALPAQAIRYVTWAGSEPPAQPGDPEPAVWDQAEVVLSAPVRMPPVDRKAAVKAGILSGGTP